MAENKPQLSTKVVPLRKSYKPVLSSRERRAYQAAHRIMSEELNSKELVTPGGRRSYYLDRVASIILESFS